MAQPPQTSGYGLMTDSPDDYGLSKKYINESRLKTQRAQQEEAARKRRQEALDRHLSQFEDDPISKAVATLEFEKKESDDYKAAQKSAIEKEHEKIKSQYDDPISQAWAVMQYDDEQQRSLPAKQAFADQEAIEQLDKRDQTSNKLDRVGLGNAFIRESIGSAVNVVPELAAVPARAMEAVGLAEPGTADELHRQSNAFQDARQKSREGDMSPWLSRMYGGASQSLLQTFATPGGAYSKIAGSGVMAGSQGLTTAEDAGLEGASRFRYAGTQALWESGFAALGQKFLGAGIESRLAGQAVAAQTWKELGKNIGMDALKEMPEEVLTSIFQDVSSKLEGVSPNMQFGDFVTNATEAAVQAAMMAPMTNAPNAGRLAIEAFSKTPSRKNYDAAVKAGLPPIDNAGQLKARETYAQDLLKDPFGMRKPDPTLETSPNIPPETVPEPAPEATNPAPEPDNGYDQQFIQDFLQEGEQDATQDETGQKPEDVTQGQPQGQTEGVLTDGPEPKATPVATGVPSPDQQQPESEAGPVSLPEHARINKGDDGLFYPGWDKPGKLPQTALMGFKTPEEAMTWFEKKPPKNTPLPSAEPPKGSIGWNNQGLPIYESKAGLRTVGTETEQATGMKDVKGIGMQAVLAGPREDLFKTEAELESDKVPEHTQFHSGLSRSPAEVDAAIASGNGVGVSAFDSLSAPMRKKLVDHANSGGKVFVDSGAFSAFKKGKDIDWDKTLFSYHELLTSVSPEKRKNMTVVAPDIVGDHKRTMDLQADLFEKFTPIIELGGQVIVPVQKENGGGEIWKHWADATNSFDEEQNDSFIVGVPFNAEAWSQDDVLDFMRSRDKDAKQYSVPPTPFHLLGAGADKVEKLFEAAAAEGLSTEGVSADAMPKSISQRKRPAKPPVPTFASLPQKSQDLFNKAFESRDVESLKQMVQKSNVAWFAEFTNRTGIKIPRNHKNALKAVLDWAKPQAEIDAEADKKPKPPKEPDPVETPAMAKGDQVSFKDRKSGKELTGTITSVDSEDGNARIKVNQVAVAGGVPIGRVEYRSVVDLKRIDQKTKPKSEKPAEPAVPTEKPEVIAPAQSQAEPSQADLMEQILRDELYGDKPESKPSKPQKTKPESPLSKEDVKQLREDVENNSIGFMRNLIQDKVSRIKASLQSKGNTAKEIERFNANLQWYEAQLAALDKMERPAKTKSPRTEKAKKRTKDTAADLKAAEDDVFKAFGSTASTGLNADQMRATARLVKAALNHQVSTFNEFVAYVINKFGEPMALRMAEGIELAWTALKRLDEYSGIDDAGKVADIIDATKKSTSATGWEAIPGHFADQLLKGERYTSITEARAEAGEIIGQPVKPGTAEAKQLDEAIEYGIVQAGRKIVSEGGTQAEIYDKLVDLYERQPTLGVRDSNSMEMQAYSTPVPLAWLVSTLGNVTAQTTVYEPTAGNGVLLIGTDVKNAFVNELDPDRAKTLRDQGFKVTEANAATATSPDVQTVLANPPFGKKKDANRKNIEFDVDGFKTKEIDHAIALRSLKGMKPGGHTVLILAAKGHNVKTELERRNEYRKTDKPFYDALYQGYDVTHHFTIDGSLYSRQGASFPVDVIVLRPLGTVPADQKRATPWAQVPRIFSTWQEIRNDNFNEDVADSGEGSGVRTGDGDNRSPDLSTRNADDVGRVPGQDENAAPVDEGDVGSGKPESVVSTPVDGKNGDRRGSTKSGGPRTQSGFSGTAANERGGSQSVSNDSTTESVGDGVDSGTGSDGVAGTSTAESEVDPETHQSTYTPSSKNKTVDTLVPTNLQDAISMALANVEDRNGPIDAFVQKELGYNKNDKFFTDLSAEQVDALALAIDSHKRGGGMVVGDMTGVGKGRVAAAMMRYAERQGLVPVFVTEKPDLFGDIYRDLADIGSDSPENPFFAQTTNNTSGADAIDLPDGRKLQTSKETAMARITEGLASLASGKGFMADVDGVPTKINAVFTMYSQLQTLKGAETQRRQLLRELMPHAFLIMDESHNAGGTVKERVNANAPPDRAALARELVQMSAGTMYLSATFAKRPDVMSLYSKTDMAKAVNGDISKLADVLHSGGLPLQQVLSAMLAETGQYIRREKSFDGVEFAKVDVNVDLAEQDKITDVFRHIRTLDNVVKEVVENLNDDLVAAGEHGVAGDVSTGDAGLTSNSFSSILWNAVDQMLFALKADKAADEAIDSWKKGEVPILAVDNTMESIIDEYVEANNLKVGDVVNLNFRDILHRYLERSRWMTVDTGQRKPNGKKILRKQRLTDAELNVDTHAGNALELFQAAYAVVESTDVNAPASPIDWLRHRMEKAGMKVSEITGRKTILVYSADGVAKLGARPKSEKGTRGKQNTIRRVNDGSIDGLLLNRSGATGVSVHASEKFKNQKVRHMIIVQAAKNIDEFMQMLGRINRTGQVVLPRYSLLMSDSPAELRPAAVLSKKLASLNASVTAKSKGAVGFDVVDVMNQVGGLVVMQYLDANPNFAYALDMYDADQGQTDDTDNLEDIVRKATGRSAILPIAQQREFWEDVTLAYNARIDQLNATNSNPLIAQTLNLDAKTISTVNLFAGEPNEGPFAAPANMERMDIKSLGKPMSPEQVNSEITEFYGIGDMKDRFTAAGKWSRHMHRTLTDEMVPFRVEAMKNFVTPEAIASRNKVLDEQFETVTDAIDAFPPGTIVEHGVVGFSLEGVVIGFRRTGKTGNPVAPSRWMIDIAVNDGSRKITLPVSQMDDLRTRNQSLDSLMESFQTGQSVSREKRWMGTGNLMAAYAKLATSNGKIIFYTDDKGETKRGIIMPRHFNASTFIENQPVQFTKPDDILTFFARGGQRMTSEDGALTVTFSSGNRRMALIAPRARSVGGKYTLNHGIITAAGQQFVSVGNTMSVGSSDRATQHRMLEAVLELTPLQVKETDSRILAREVLGLTKTGQPIETESPDSEPDSVAEPEPESELRKSAREAQEAVEAQKAENARQNKIIVDELRKDSLMGAGLPISKELATAVATRMLGSIKLGVKRFDALIKELRADFDESVVTALKPNLIRMWNAVREKHGLDDATEAGFNAAMSDTVDVDVEQAVAAVTPEPASEVAEPERTYSTKNAFTDAERPGLDMPERKPPETQHREPSIAAAEEFGKTQAGSDFTDELISELRTTQRAATPYENDLVLYRRAELGRKLEAALRKKVAAQKANDDVQTVVADTEAQALRLETQSLIDLISGSMSSSAGRNLQARKAVVDQDFSLVRQTLEFAATHDGRMPEGKELADITAKVDALEAEVAALEAELAAAQAKNNDLETRLKEAHEAAVADVQTAPPSIPEPAPAPTAPAEPAAPAEKTRKEKTREKIENAYKRIASMLKEGHAFSVGGALGESASVFIDLATGYSELGVLTLGDFLNRVGKRMGPAAKKLRPQLTAAWKQVRSMMTGPADISQITDKIDILDPETIGRAARDLHRYVIERDGIDASAEGRNAAVVAVHQILADFVPGITEDEVARAMSGIGIYSELSKDEIDVIRRDQKAQLLLLEQIADWKKGTPPPATGQERAPVSDEQRFLRRTVNEAKKESGVDHQTEGQLSSALSAAKRMAQNRIADLTKALSKDGKRIERSKKVLQSDAELKALMDERDALQYLYDEVYGKNELTDEQRISRAEKMLDRAIIGLEADLKKGVLYRDAKQRTPVESNWMPWGRAALDALKASRDEMRLQSGEAQARSDAAFERHLLEREAKLARRLADGDFKPKPKKPEREYTPSMLAKMLSIQKMQQQLMKDRKHWEFSKKHPVYRTWKKGPVAGAHIIRKALTMWDQSLIGRQGFLLGFTHPIIYGKSISKAFASNMWNAKSLFPTEQDLFNTQAALDADAKWVRLEKIGKVAVTDVHGGINREEGSQFVPEWFDKLPGVGSSERAGSAFINTQRRLVFRSLVEKLAKKYDGNVSAISNAELRVIGNMVNIASGRGSLGAWANSLEAMTAIFFSPRWWMSRLQWWAGQPLWHDAKWTGGEGASWEVRQMAAVEWAKQAAAQLAIMTLAVAGLTAAFGKPGEDEEWDWYGNWKSPDFGRIRIGNSYIDMTAGLGQHLSLFARLFSGEQVDRWETKKVDALGVIGRHERGKLAPVPSAIVDYFAGESISKDKFGSKEWLLSHVAPLITQDVYKSTKEEGVPLGPVLAAMMFFGAGAQTREARLKERDDVANNLRALTKQGKQPAKIQQILNDHLEHAASEEARSDIRTAAPEDQAGLQKVIDGKKSPELDAAIQKEKYDIILNASGRVSTDPKRLSDEKEFTGSDDKSRKTARELVKTIAPTMEQAIDLYEAAYRAKNKSLYEDGKIKKSVHAGRARIKSIYQNR